MKDTQPTLLVYPGCSRPRTRMVEPREVGGMNHHYASHFEVGHEFGEWLLHNAPGGFFDGLSARLDEWVKG